MNATYLCHDADPVENMEGDVMCGNCDTELWWRGPGSYDWQHSD